MSKETKQRKRTKQQADFDTDINLSESIAQATREISTMSQDTDPEERAKADTHLKTLVECEEKITKSRKEYKRSIFFKILCWGLSVLLMFLGFVIPGAGGKLTDIGDKFMNRK